ncbi:MAG: hypothetical protein QM704_05605 [Anaeromyxobacteraceae bacterium]
MATKKRSLIAPPGGPASGPQARLAQMRIVAQDPSVRGRHGEILTAVVDVPAETLAAGPRGYRVHVIDYDASTGRLYPPVAYDREAGGWRADPAAEVTEEVVLRDTGFHAQNVYAIVMRTLARFEFALGRRIGWGFDVTGHQIKVAPHAFADANAFYSRRDEALLFGHFPTRDGKGHVFSCLSHDIVAHETSHAVLDGLRKRFMDPSSPDQAAFHEGFADVVALLSVFAVKEVVRVLVDVPAGGRADARGPLRDVSVAALRRSALFALGKQFGREMGAIGRSALRASADLVARPGLARLPEFDEPHRRGEILVAAILHAFLAVWSHRLTALRRHGPVDRDRAAEEGSDIADDLLTVAIRALDYCPPVHLRFGHFLSAMVTADREVRPRDARYGVRDALVAAFEAFGIGHESVGRRGEARVDPGWQQATKRFDYDRTRFESMQRDPDEVFRFVWENRRELRLFSGAYTRVLSVRPCVRVAPEDGFTLRETVAEVFQQLSMLAGELGAHGIEKPEGMPDDTAIMLLGGVTLVFDEYGHVKYTIGDSVHDPSRPNVQARQSERLKSLWDHGFFRRTAAAERRFSAVHRARSLDPVTQAKEAW